MNHPNTKSRKRNVKIAEQYVLWNKDTILSTHIIRNQIQYWIIEIMYYHWIRFVQGWLSIQRPVGVICHINRLIHEEKTLYKIQHPLMIKYIKTYLTW